MSKLPDDIITEEKIAKLEDKEAKQSKKNKKLKDKINTKNIIIAILVIIILLLLFRSCQKAPQMEVTPDIERIVYDIPDEYDMTEHEDGKVAVMGWNEGQKTISKSNPALVLKNVSANIGHYYLKFKVTEGDDVLYESGLVSPGSMVAPNFPKDMKIGTHYVVVSVTAYSVDDTSKQLSTTNINLKLIITK